VSDYWATFFDSLQKILQWDYKRISETFLREFLQIPPLLIGEWLNNFHVHFICRKDVPVDLSGWHEWRNSHHNSVVSQEKVLKNKTLWRYNPNLGNGDEGIGWLPVDPREYYVGQVLMQKGR
jgi:hypothetical protein